MKYRKFGKTGFDVSVLGFGAMRLPENPDKTVDEKEAVNIMRFGIDNGINYIDTAYVYHGGRSEGIVAKALQDGYRKKIKIATKSPMWLIKQPEDFDRFLDEQLTRLQTGNIDYYLMHGLGTWSWDLTLKFDLMKRAQMAVKNGKISHIGFSFHDNLDSFKKIVDGYDKWEFCQIQYNYMDTENQAGTAGLKYAASKGIPVIVMEPLLGGRLARPPKEVKAVFEAAGKNTPADWALQWVWDQPGVSTILSGMSSMQQLKENLGSAEKAGAGSFGPAEHAVIAKAKEKYLARTVIPCTDCGYCMPCKQGVNISKNFELYNNSVIYDDPGSARFWYNHFFEDAQKSDKCTQCRDCEALCPQKIEVSSWMGKVRETLSE
jgi:predicted aldo/keto reductase-like oxidoreductase